MTDVTGVRTESCRPDAIESRIANLLRNLALPVGDCMRIIVDVHSPFHPSTGLVTNPDTVAAVIDWLLDSENIVDRIELGGAATMWGDSDACRRYIGYDQLTDRAEVEWFDPSDDSHVTRTVSVEDRRKTVSVPESLLENVLVVPTLRRSDSRWLASGLNRLAATALERNPTATETIAFGAVCDPASLLDATYTYNGTPHRTRTLLASDHAPAIDRIAARLLDLSPREGPVAMVNDGKMTINGVDIDSIAGEIPQGSVKEESPSWLMKSGYRTYARIVGDHLPPQLTDQ